MPPSARQACRRCGARARSLRRQGAFSSPLRQHRQASRCSRSAARAATRRSGSLRERASSVDVSSRSSTIPQSARRGAPTLLDAGLEEWAELVEGDAHATLAATRGHVRPRLPRRGEGRLRGPLRSRPTVARAGRPRGCRQRPLACRDARGVLGRSSGRDVAFERHGPARPRPRAVGRARFADRRSSLYLHPLGVRMLRYRGKEVVRLER